MQVFGGLFQRMSFTHTIKKKAPVLSHVGTKSLLIAYKIQAYQFCFLFHWRLHPPSYFLLFSFPFFFPSLQLCQELFLVSDFSFLFPFLSLLVSVAVLFSPSFCSRSLLSFSLLLCSSASSSFSSLFSLFISSSSQSMSMTCSSKIVKQMTQ